MVRESDCFENNRVHLKYYCLSPRGYHPHNQVSRLKTQIILSCFRIKSSVLEHKMQRELGAAWDKLLDFTLKQLRDACVSFCHHSWGRRLWQVQRAGGRGVSNSHSCLLSACIWALSTASTLPFWVRVHSIGANGEVLTTKSNSEYTGDWEREMKKVLRNKHAVWGISDLIPNFVHDVTKTEGHIKLIFSDSVCTGQGNFDHTMIKS